MVALGWVLDRSCGKVWRPKHWIGYIIVYRCQLGTSYVSTLPCPLLHHIATIAQYITDISWYAFRTSVERAAALNFKWGAPFETYYTIPYIHIERSYHCVVHVCLVLFFFRFFPIFFFLLVICCCGRRASFCPSLIARMTNEKKKWVLLVRRRNCCVCSFRNKSWTIKYCLCLCRFRQQQHQLILNSRISLCMYCWYHHFRFGHFGKFVCCKTLTVPSTHTRHSHTPHMDRCDKWIIHVYVARSLCVFVMHDFIYCCRKSFSANKHKTETSFVWVSILFVANWVWYFAFCFGIACPYSESSCE